MSTSTKGNGTTFKLHTEVSDKTLKTQEEVAGFMGALEATFICSECEGLISASAQPHSPSQ